METTACKRAMVGAIADLQQVRQWHSLTFTLDSAATCRVVQLLGRLGGSSSAVPSETSGAGALTDALLSTISQVRQLVQLSPPRHQHTIRNQHTAIVPNPWLHSQQTGW